MAEERTDFVRKEGDRWCVYSHDGRRLACHDTEEAANRQLRAIEAAKHARMASRTDGDASKIVFRQDYQAGALAQALTREDSIERLPSGGVRVDARVARTGVYVYRSADGGEYREYRPDSEVFDPAALASYRDAPVTDLHPQEFVTSSNWREHAAGHVSGEPTRDGRFVSASLVVHDGGVARAIEDGDRQECSPGYTCVLDETPGITPDGEPYHAVQRAIRVNHVAIGPRNWARGGPEVAIRRDGDAKRSGWISIDQMRQLCPPCAEKMDALHMREVRADVAALAVLKRLDAGFSQGMCDHFGDAEGFRTRCMASTLAESVDDVGAFCDALKIYCHGSASAGDSKETSMSKVKIDGTEHEVGEGTKQAVERLAAERDATRGKVDALDAELKAAQARVAAAEDPKRVHEMVRARVQLEQLARKMLGSEERLDDFTDRQVWERAILKADPKAKFDGLSDDYVRARFETEAKHFVERTADGGILRHLRGIQPAPTASGAPTRFDDHAASRALAAQTRDLYRAHRMPGGEK